MSRAGDHLFLAPAIPKKRVAMRVLPHLPCGRAGEVVHPVGTPTPPPRHKLDDTERHLDDEEQPQHLEGAVGQRVRLPRREQRAGDAVG